MLPSSSSLGTRRTGLAQQPLVSVTGFARASSACNAHIPHYRQHVTRGGAMLPRVRPGRRRPLLAPERQPSAADEVAVWLLSGHWKQQLATGVPQACQRARSGLQALCLALAAASQQARSTWQYVLANWPAWQASLQEDAAVLFEYAVGLIPAWLAVTHASVLRMSQDVAAWEPMQQVVSATAGAVAAAEAAAAAVRELAQQRLQETLQLVRPPWGAGHSSLQPAGQHPGDGHDHQNSTRRSSRSEAARVAYSMAWFGFGQLSAGQQQLAHHQQQLQQMSLYDWRQLQQQELPADPARPKRWRTPQRRGWVDRVASRARGYSSSSSSSQAYHLPAGDHLWRTRHEDGGWDAPGRHVAGALSAAQQGVQGCVEAVQTTGRAAAGNVQRMTTMLVTPVQAVVQQMRPPPAGVMAAAAVLLAGALASSLSRRQREASVLAQQQQLMLKQRAEELRAQKARIMGVLSVEVPSGTSSRRKGAVATARTSIPVTVAGAGVDFSEADADADAMADSSVIMRDVQLDEEAAAMWKKFLAGSRATEVPMWDNRMVEDLPKVSRKEVDRQTQKIRAAAAPEECAALEQADMDQLTKQLQQLDHAPIGRKARAAWLKEQQLKQQQQPAQSQQLGGAAPGASAKGRSSSSDDRPSSSPVDDSNPFAISPEVRAKWDSDLQDAPVAPPARKPAARTSSSSGASSRSSSRSGSRSSNRTADGSSNPFAISREARAQWDAEDHMFSEPAAKPLLGSVLGGLVTAFTSGKAQPNTAQQHQHRRRQQLKAEEAEAAVMLRLQQQQEQGLGSSSTAQPQGSTPSRAAGSAAPQQLSQRQSGASGAKPSVPWQSSGAAAAAAVPAASPTGGGEGPVEGSPEWNEKLRQDMLRSGAARRARMQQIQQQGPHRQVLGTSSPGTQGRQQPAQDAAPSVAPRAAASGGEVQQSDAGGQQRLPRPAATSSSAGSLSAVSVADAQGVTAAIPTVASTGKLQGTVGGPAQAAAATPDTERPQPSNPFAVSKDAAVEGDSVLEVGK